MACTRPAGEPPEQPGVHGAEAELAALRPRAQRRDRGRAASGSWCPRSRRRARARSSAGSRGSAPSAREPVAERGGAPALPDDRVADRAAGGALPQDRGLALVGDADRGDLGRRDAGGGQRLAEGLHGGGPDLLRIVLDPARLREVLRQLGVAARPHRPVGIHDAARSSRSCPDRARGRSGARSPAEHRLGEVGAIGDHDADPVADEALDGVRARSPSTPRGSGRPAAPPRDVGGHQRAARGRRSRRRPGGATRAPARSPVRGQHPRRVERAHARVRAELAQPPPGLAPRTPSRSRRA